MNELDELFTDLQHIGGEAYAPLPSGLLFPKALLPRLSDTMWADFDTTLEMGFNGGKYVPPDTSTLFTEFLGDHRFQSFHYLNEGTDSIVLIGRSRIGKDDLYHAVRVSNATVRLSDPDRADRAPLIINLQADLQTKHTSGARKSRLEVLSLVHVTDINGGILMDMFQPLVQSLMTIDCRPALFDFDVAVLPNGIPVNVDSGHCYLKTGEFVEDELIARDIANFEEALARRKLPKGMAWRDANGTPYQQMFFPNVFAAAAGPALCSPLPPRQRR